jgi:hypothetical protein
MKSVGCLTTVLGNVGSTEEMFLAGFPSGFRYVPGLQEASVMAHRAPRELYVSVNTVRTHMRHLYDKLGAHRRLEAIDQARSLGLLRPVPQRALTLVSAGRIQTWRLA